MGATLNKFKLVIWNQDHSPPIPSRPPGTAPVHSSDGDGDIQRGIPIDDVTKPPAPEFELPDHLLEPRWMSFEKSWYFGTHKSIWRIRCWNALFWVIGMMLFVVSFLTGMMGSVTTLYLGTALCWVSSFIFKETSLTATCLVGTALSVWQGGDVLSQYWRFQMGNVDRPAAEHHHHHN
jgi:hypothetical protein